MSSSSLSQPNAFRDIILVALPIVVLGAIGNIVGLSTLAGGAIINVGYVLAIVTGSMILKRQGSSWKAIGLAKPASVTKTALLGAAAFFGAVITFMLLQLIAAGVLQVLGMLPSAIDESRFNPIKDNLPYLLLMLTLAWTTIPFGEEMFYRAFLMTRLTDHASVKKPWAIIISGVVFGVVHFAEGPVGILSNGGFGLLYAWIFVRSDRNLWITIVGHGLLNSLRFVLLYSGAV